MQLLKKINHAILILPVLIFSFGYMVLLSTAYELSRSQLIFFVVSLLIYSFVALVDYRIWGEYWKLFYTLTIAALIFTFVFGQTTFGSTRWIQIGTFTLQPSEFAKITLVLGLSYYISQKKKSLQGISAFTQLAKLFLPIFLLVLIQPDLGTSILLLSILVVTLLYSGFDKIYFLVGFIFAGLLSSPIWNALKSYQKERVLVFLNPTLDMLGSGYNVIQSRIAIGSGKLFGRGFGRGTQSHLQFLPVYWTDFIFAAFAEEWGFLGTFLLLILFVLLFISILHVAAKVQDSFGSLLVMGAFTVIFVQFLINIGMNLGLMPVTGIPLPLVSHGGSSLISTMILLGLVQSVWTHQKS